jgi:pimeloyl-ACP methyl ester carboxylesterase
MNTITTKDGTQIYYKDWRSGQPVVFSHGWPLSADAWEDQMVFLAAHGFSRIAHDRRGHGRSSQPRNGNDMDLWVRNSFANGTVASNKSFPDRGAALSLSGIAPLSSCKFAYGFLCKAPTGRTEAR